MKSKNNPIVYIYLAIAFIVGYILFKFIFPMLSRKLGMKELEQSDKLDEQQVSDVESEIKDYDLSQNLTYPKSDYYNFATGIFNSVGYLYDDSYIVNSYLRKLNNELDFLYLKKSFGKKLSGVYGFQEWRTLEEYLQYYYNDNPDIIKKFNDILKSKDIKYRI
jgi:hypothetical protein